MTNNFYPKDQLGCRVVGWHSISLTREYPPQTMPRRLWGLGAKGGGGADVGRKWRR
jgi:hypothetical protein